MNNSIVAANPDSTGPDDLYLQGLVLNSSNNLVGVDETASLSAADNNLLNVSNPELGPLANNGGPTETMALLPGSQAMYVGSIAAVSGTTDQRGFPRIVNGAVDIGAFEGQEENTTTTAQRLAGHLRLRPDCNVHRDRGTASRQRRAHSHRLDPVRGRRQ